jgi:hypothetical protein
MTEIITSAENVNPPEGPVTNPAGPAEQPATTETPTAEQPATTPDELFMAFMQQNNFVPVVMVTTPMGGRVMAEEFVESRLRKEGWGLIVTVAKDNRQ